MQGNSVMKVRENNTGEAIKWTAKMVEDRFREAILTLKKLPPVKQRGYFNLWPEVIHSSNELLFQEKKPMRPSANPGAIARLEQTFEWITWLEIDERKLIWKRAAKMNWRTICWDLDCSRVTAWRKWLMACNKISAILNATNRDKNKIKNF